MQKRLSVGGAVTLAISAGVMLYAQSAYAKPKQFRYHFSVNGTLNEAPDMDRSSSPYFWVSSGGVLNIWNETGRTYYGDQEDTLWGRLYAITNSLDTDQGVHPQNLFRLVTKSIWQNMSQQVYVRMRRYYASASPNRAGHNGILLFNRYMDEGQTLYYVGVRVDGAAVIKRKYKGTYTTLAYKHILEGSYDRLQNPNLIPIDAWFGIRAVVQNLDSHTVSIKLFLDMDNNHLWGDPVLEVIDKGREGGGPIITGGFGGIRTDFADVEFKGYRIAELW